MRAREFVRESVDADQVLQYVKRAHAPEEFNIEYSITDHPQWELKNIPVSQLKLDPDHYDVIPLRAPEQQPTPQPLGAGRELVGWEIRIDGQPVHTLSGIGNNQGDANRLAQQWILRQGSSFLRQHQGGEVEVVPAWREA